MSGKIYCGEIIINSQTYKIEWEPLTLLVWAIDQNGYSRNFGAATAIDKNAALKCAKEMIKNSGS